MHSQLFIMRCCKSLGHASYLRRICNLTLKMQKLVTLGSLRLGLELSGKENCIGFYPILSDCKSVKICEVRKNS